MFSCKHAVRLTARKNHFTLIELATVHLPAPPQSGWVVSIGTAGYRIGQVYVTGSGFTAEAEKVTLPNVKDRESRANITWNSV